LGPRILQAQGQGGHPPCLPLSLTRHPAPRSTFIESMRLCTGHGMLAVGVGDGREGNRARSACGTWTNWGGRGAMKGEGDEDGDRDEDVDARVRRSCPMSAREGRAMLHRRGASARTLKNSKTALLFRHLAYLPRIGLVLHTSPSNREETRYTAHGTRGCVEVTVQVDGVTGVDAGMRRRAAEEKEQEGPRMWRLCQLRLEVDIEQPKPEPEFARGSGVICGMVRHLKSLGGQGHDLPPSLECILDRRHLAQIGHGGARWVDHNTGWLPVWVGSQEEVGEMVHMSGAEWMSCGDGQAAGGDDMGDSLAASRGGIAVGLELLPSSCSLCRIRDVVTQMQATIGWSGRDFSWRCRFLRLAPSPSVASVHLLSLSTVTLPVLTHTPIHPAPRTNFIVLHLHLRRWLSRTVGECVPRN
ncbi:hypothetical protein C8F04DRAFT_1315148, partial [Mycena alexandri]